MAAGIPAAGLAQARSLPHPARCLPHAPATRPPHRDPAAPEGPAPPAQTAPPASCRPPPRQARPPGRQAGLQAAPGSSQAPSVARHVRQAGYAAAAVQPGAWPGRQQAGRQAERQGRHPGRQAGRVGTHRCRCPACAPGSRPPRRQPRGRTHPQKRPAAQRGLGAARSLHRQVGGQGVSRRWKQAGGARSWEARALSQPGSQARVAEAGGCAGACLCS